MEQGEKDSLGPQLDHVEQLFKELPMFNDCFNYHGGFISIVSGKLPLESILSNIEFHHIENHHHLVRNFVGTMTL